MKGYKQIFAIAVFTVFIIPQIAFASWWNPFSWFKKTSPTVQQIQLPPRKDEANKNSSAIKLNSNQDKIQQPVIQKDSKPAVSLNKARLENKNSLVQESLKLTNKKIIAVVKPAVVYLETDSGSGSGMIFDPSGFILTNAHVVSGVSQVRAILSDGRNFIGTVIGRDEIKDLAVVQIQASGLSYVAFGDSDSVEQGDQIFTLGYPFGLEGDVSFKEGTISRRVNFNGALYIEISAEIHPGNSGGPLVDETGKVIGINSLAVGSGSTGALRFAIPINNAKLLIPDLENGRTVFKPRVIVPQAPQVPVPVQPVPQPYVPPQASPTPYVPPTYIPPAPPTPINVDLTIEGNSSPATNFSVFRAKTSGQPASIKSVTLKETGTMTDADVAYVSYLDASNNYKTAQMVNQTITINFDASHGNRIYVFPKLNPSGFGKTFAVSVSSLDAYLNSGENLGNISGLNKPYGYIVYPETPIIIPEGSGNADLVKFCETKSSTVNPTPSYWKDMGCSISY